MSQVGSQAPDHALNDQFGREVSLSQFRGKSHVMLLFYPLDWTPTWSREVPAVEASLARFRAAGTQVLGVSVDSIHSHINWGASLGGVSFPLLADFEPKGALAKKLGLYLDGPGITDRATVLIDSQGVIRYSESVGPGGVRDIDALVAECEKLNAEQPAPAALPESQGLEADSCLFVKSACGPSLRAGLCLDNLKAREALKVCNVSEDSAAAAQLESSAGKNQAPCLLVGGKPMFEAGDILKYLANRLAPLPA